MVSNDETRRRRHNRVEFSTRIILKSTGMELDVTCDSKNLSLSGIFVKTDKKIQIGAHCVITIILSGGIEDVELSINSSVARIEENGLGIVFDTMDLDTYTHLKNIVQYNSQQTLG